MDNLRQYDENEWPRITDLIGYRSRQESDINYYNHKGVDYFLELGEWLRDKNALRRKEIAAQRKKNQLAQQAQRFV